MRGVLRWCPPRPFPPQIQGSVLSEPLRLEVSDRAGPQKTKTLANLACRAFPAQNAPNAGNLTGAHPALAPPPAPPPRVLRGKELWPGERIGRGFREEFWALRAPVGRRAFSPERAEETPGARLGVVEECLASSPWASMAWSWRLWSRPCGSWAGRAGPASHVLSLPSHGRPGSDPLTQAAALVEMLLRWLERFSLREAVERTRGVAANLRVADPRGGVVGWPHFTSAAPGSSSLSLPPKPQGDCLRSGRERSLPNTFWSLSYIHLLLESLFPYMEYLTHGLSPVSVLYDRWWRDWFLPLRFDPKLPSEEKSLLLISVKVGQLLGKVRF